MERFAKRALATFVYNAGAILPAASLLGGWPVWKAAITAGISAVVQMAVTESKKFLEESKELLENPAEV
jgi:hypothetical protein